MAKFKINIGGQNFQVDAPNKELLPEIVETITREQGFQKERAVTNVKGATHGEFIGEITNPPSIADKFLSAIPSTGQFAGGVGGGLVGGRFGKPNIGGAIGGTAGRGLGELLVSSSRQAVENPLKFIKNVSTLGPLAGTINGMADSERQRFGKEILRTGAIETVFGATGKFTTKLATNITSSIGRALLGDRVVERGAEVGFKAILDPKFYKGRLAKDVAIKSNNFFKKLTSVTGKQTAKAINKSGVGNSPAPVEQIKKSIHQIDLKFKGIDNFGLDVSPAQKKIIKEIRRDILDMDDNLTISELWESRKKFDDVRFGKVFKGEAREYLDSVRKVISDPIRNSSDEVAESFGRYSFVKNQEDNLGSKLVAETLGNPKTTGEIFAPKTEGFISTLTATNKDETVRLLRQLDDFLGADDKVVEELLNASAAEAIEKGNIGITLPGRVIARLLGGRKGVAQLGAIGQNNVSSFLKRGVGRSIPTTVSELLSEDQE